MLARGEGSWIGGSGRGSVGLHLNSCHQVIQLLGRVVRHAVRSDEVLVGAAD